jgi:hypothetical protein
VIHIKALNPGIGTENLNHFDLLRKRVVPPLRVRGSWRDYVYSVPSIIFILFNRSSSLISLSPREHQERLSSPPTS